MSQMGFCFDDEPEVTEAAAVDLPPVHIPPSPVAKKPAGEGPQLDAWTRETQRHYLLYLIGAIPRLTYRESFTIHARAVLVKLNGLGGEW
jgi:hypothetical protein